MRITVRDAYWSRQLLQQEIDKIPKKNRHKFHVDLLKLVNYAQEDNYDNFDF